MGSFVYLALTAYAFVTCVSFENHAHGLPYSWTNSENDTDVPRIVSRKEWHARPALARVPMEVTPPPYVVIHHGGIAKYCYDQETCSSLVREYQNLHLDKNGWFDIGYNFVVGEDGNVYEGRGWDINGAHAPGYNTQSIGICVIGDFTDRLPNKAALKAVNDLINYGVSLGKIREDYHVLGHRQARRTECPGEIFYRYVKKHPRWTDVPIPRFPPTTTTEPTINLSDNVVSTNTRV